MNGWISLHRKVLDNPIVCKDNDYLATWIYLLLNATHTNYDGVFRGKRVTLQPGQLITGRKSISLKLKINESKVQRILKTFENEQQIEQQTSNQNRLITICNWNSYQLNEQQIKQPVNNERTTDEQPVNTNNNVNKDNNENKGNSRTQKHKYGEYNNVLLSDEELNKLQIQFPNDWQERIERVSEYCASTGKTYKNFLATIRNWAKKENAVSTDNNHTWRGSEKRL